MSSTLWEMQSACMCWKLGVSGVAIPSLVSRGVAGVVLLRFCIIRTIWSFSPEENLKVDATIVKRILFIGIQAELKTVSSSWDVCLWSAS